MENVPGILTMRKGDAIKEIIELLLISVIV